jgi:hypothetical protein
VTDVPSSPHLSEAEIAALIYAVGQDRELERRAYSHLAHCDECTRLIGSLRDADRNAGSLLTSLDVPAPATPVESIVRAARREKRRDAFGGRRAAAIVAFLLVAAVAAAAIQASPIHRFLATVLASGGGTQAHVKPSRASESPAALTPAVSFVTEPNSSLEVAFGGNGVGGDLEVRVVDGDEVSLSSPGAGATYRVGSNRIAVEQSAPAQFQLQVPRSLRELRVRVGGSVVFDRRPTVADPSSSFTIRLATSHASR